MSVLSSAFYVPLLSIFIFAVVLVALKYVAFKVARVPMNLHSDMNWTTFVTATMWLAGAILHLITQAYR